MKKLFLTMMTVLLISSLLSAAVFAADYEGDNGAYCTPEKQHELAELLRGNADLKKEMDLYGFDVLEESISPKYYVDLYEYAKTGKLDVVRLCKWKDDGSMDETKPCYYAMLITKENEYAGGIIFWSDGKAAEYGPFELTA